MGHTPFGYRIENGKAVIDEAAAAQVRDLHKNYLSGLSLTNAAKEAGLDLLHAGAKRMMLNRHYLGDDFYPAIIGSGILRCRQCGAYQTLLKARTERPLYCTNHKKATYRLSTWWHYREL